MNFVTSVFKKYIKNESQQADNNERASKLVVAPSSQKPRRSVLKEFDPLAPFSPCPPPKPTIKNPDVIDEDEVFEDAETSLTSYVCPRNKTLENNSEYLKTHNRDIHGTRISWLIPELKDNAGEEQGNLNDTADMSYAEALENLSHIDGFNAMDKTSSEEDIEFHYSKKQVRNPDTANTNELAEGTLMADSLENSFDGFNQQNSTIENVKEPLIKLELQHTEREHEQLDTMVDSLELPNLKENIPALENKSGNYQEMVDSLENLKIEENLEILKVEDNMSEDVFVNEGHETVTENNANQILEAQSTGIIKTETNLSQSDQEEPSKLDTTFEGRPMQEETQIVNNSDQITTSYSKNVELNKTFETPLTNSESKIDRLPHDQINTSHVANIDIVLPYTGAGKTETNLSKSDQKEPSKLDTTFEGCPMQVETQIVNNFIQITTSDSKDVELNKTFETPLTNLESKFDRLPNDQINTFHDNVANIDIVLPSTDTGKTETNLSKSDQESSKVDTTHEACPRQEETQIVNNCNQITTSDSKDVEFNKTFETPEETPLTNLESKFDRLPNDQINTFHDNVANIDIVLPSTDMGKTETNLSKSDQESSKLDTTYEACPTQEETQIVNNSNQIPSSDSNNSSDNVGLNKTFETPLTTLESRTDQLPDNQMKPHDDIATQSIGTVNTETNLSKSHQESSKLDTTYEACPTQGETHIVNNSNQITLSASNSSSDNVELNTTFETPLTTLESRAEQLPDNQMKPHDDIATQSTATVKTETNLSKTDQESSKLDTTYEACSTQEETQIIINSNPIISSDSKNSNENVELNKTFETPVQSKVDQFQSDNIIASDVNAGQTVQNLEQEGTKSEHIFISSDIPNVEGHSVSLKDIIGSVKADGSKDVNSTFLTDEQAAESSRVMEALAQSLNQTIDVEASAIVDDTKSTDTSGDLSQDEQNVTLETVVERPVTEDKGVLKCDEKTEKLNSDKSLERKETEEFENLERQYETTQNIKSCVKQAVDDLDAVINKIAEGEMDTVGEDYSKVFQRQDTREFETLERECNENAQKVPDATGSDLNTNGDVNKENERCKEDISDDKDIKGIIRQDTQECEDFERECTAKSDALKLNENATQNAIINTEENDNANTSEPAIKEPVNGDQPVPGHIIKVRVSGNICNANAVGGKFEQVETAGTLEQPFAGINLKTNEKELKEPIVENNSSNNIAQVNDNNEPTFAKTDKAVVAKEVAIENVTNENIYNKPECQPSTRSLRNETQVTDRPVAIDDTSKAAERAKYEKQLNEYKTKSEDLKKQVDKLQSEISTVRTENMRKDKYILTCALDIESERDTIIKLRKALVDREEIIANQCEELKRLKEEEKRNAKGFTNLEMAFADVFEKYEKTKVVIGVYKENEEILRKNLQCAEDQLTKYEAKCLVVNKQFSEKLTKINEQMAQEKEKYRQDIAKLQAQAKRLEIKCSSLETALRQKNEECQALSALCDDITGKPM